MTYDIFIGVTNPSFPRSSAYHPAWVLSGVSGGANPLWLTEWLTSALDLKPGMRVLDLGCGRALSSIFLHREYGVQVWATDLWFSATENLQRIRDAGLQDHIFPIHADARALPFADEFFDAIIAVDSFVYYGTDDCFLSSLARFLKPGGLVAMAGAGLDHEWEAIPDSLTQWWEPSMSCLHSAAWWSRHWQRSGIVDVDLADQMPDGWRHWLAWQRAVAPGNVVEIGALEADQGAHLAYCRVIARRRAGISLDPPVSAVLTNYAKHPVLRG